MMVVANQQCAAAIDQPHTQSMPVLQHIAHFHELGKELTKIPHSKNRGREEEKEGDKEREGTEGARKGKRKEKGKGKKRKKARKTKEEEKEAGRRATHTSSAGRGCRKCEASSSSLGGLSAKKGLFPSRSTSLAAAGASTREISVYSTEGTNTFLEKQLEHTNTTPFSHLRL